MPPRSRRSSKGQKQNPPQFRILSRPSSPEKNPLLSATDLSEFEVPSKKTSSDLPKEPSITPQETTVPTTVNTKTATKTLSRPKSMPTATSYDRHRGIAPTSKISINEKIAQSPPPIFIKAGSPLPRQPRSPPSFQTPLRKSVPPSQFYAGPSFHASPAASALPMPSFSKSVPDLQKNESLNSMMGKEGKRTDSDAGDESPTLRKSRMVEGNQSDKEPGFDKAPQINLSETSQIQKEKEPGFDKTPQTNLSETSQMQKENNANNLADASSIGSPCTDVSQLASSSTSPENPKSRQVVHSIENSVGLFPLEIDDDSTPLTTPKVDKYSESLPIDLSSTPISLDEEQRKAKTLELKKLLLSPAPQRSLSATTGIEAGSKELSESPAFSRTHSLQDSPTPAPALGSKFTNSQPKPQQRTKSSLATFSNSLNNSEHKPRNLYKQLRSPSSSGFSHRSELPTSPTPIRWHDSHRLSIQKNQNSNKSNIKSPSALNASSQTSLQTSSPGVIPNLSRDSELSKSMEAYLRRVLQLDMHGRNGVNGIEI